MCMAIAGRVMLYWTMNKGLLLSVLFPLVLLFALPGDASAFGALGGACEKDCTRCHSITKEEATDIFRKLNPDIEVLGVGLGPVGGLWEVVVEAKGKKGVAYIDFSLKHIITGSVINVDTRDNLTQDRLYELNRVDFSQIPLGDALLLGRRDARYRAIVFDDPD
jgi:thiol:disulfide interchange protein DsbC